MQMLDRISCCSVVPSDFVTTRCRGRHSSGCGRDFPVSVEMPLYTGGLETSCEDNHTPAYDEMHVQPLSAVFLAGRCRDGVREYGRSLVQNAHVGRTRYKVSKGKSSTTEIDNCRCR